MAFGVRSTESRNSGKVTQSHGMPACMEAKGIASTRTMDCMAWSRASGCTGAKPKPQLPITTEVMPCHDEMVQ